MNSKECLWRYREERFRFIASMFDVDAAKRILAKHGRESKRFDVSKLFEWVGTEKEQGLIGVDWKVAEGVDLDFPVILITMEPGPFLIDGWHRVAKAMLTSTTTIDGFLLTAAESKKVRIQ